MIQTRQGFSLARAFFAGLIGAGRAYVYPHCPGGCSMRSAALRRQSGSAVNPFQNNNGFESTPSQARSTSVASDIQQAILASEGLSQAVSLRSRLSITR